MTTTATTSATANPENPIFCNNICDDSTENKEYEKRSHAKCIGRSYSCNRYLQNLSDAAPFFIAGLSVGGPVSAVAASVLHFFASDIYWLFVV